MTTQELWQQLTDAGIEIEALTFGAGIGVKSYQPEFVLREKLESLGYVVEHAMLDTDDWIPATTVWFDRAVQL